MAASTPILPAHIEDTVQAIAELHRQHQREATPVQRLVERLTQIAGRPRFVGLLTLGMAAWAALNLLLPFLGYAALDAPPFPWLQDFAGLLALYITMLILITQRRADVLTEAREQLTLELAILSEQKNAKIIALLEEMRRDSPHLANRHDAEALALSQPADPQAVLDAIQDAHGDMVDDIAGSTASAS